MPARSASASAEQASEAYWGILSLAMLALVTYIATQIHTVAFERDVPEQTEDTSDASLHEPQAQANGSTMQLLDISLPNLPPQISEQAPKPKTINKDSIPEDIFKDESPVVGEFEQKTSEQQYGNQTKASEVPSSHEVSDIHVQQVLEGLSDVQLQIAMPASQMSRERTLKYLYRCVGVGLAALQSDNNQARAVQNQLMPLTKMPSQQSKILRQISGNLSAKEGRLSAAYAPTASLIRIYPESFDIALSSHIAHNLNGTQLKQFYAEYHLHQNMLSVTNIRLNNKQLAQTWLLFDGYQHNCRL